MNEWVKRWQEGKTAFHEGHPNTFLTQYVERLGAARRVLVPLCGKAEDLAYLASRGHEVVGIELAEQAVQEFFRDHDLSPAVRDAAPGVRSYSAGPITLFAGDVFACTKDLLGRIDSFYDRAALIALPPETRIRYVAHVRKLLEPQATGILVNVEYAANTFSPPPFSVGDEEIRRLYAGAQVDKLAQRVAEGRRLREENIEATEACYAIGL